MPFLDRMGLTYYHSKIKALLSSLKYAGSNTTGGAANSAAKLESARSIGNASFDGTANITLVQMGAAAASHNHDNVYATKNSPAITGDMSITGNLTLKGTGNYGNKINFGDGDYVHLHEIRDDTLNIKANTLSLQIGNAYLGDSAGNSQSGYLALKEALFNSGWISPVIQSGFCLYSESFTLYYRKVGTTVYIIGAVSNPSTILTTDTPKVVFTLPSGYRPKTDFLSFPALAGAKSTFEIRIEQGGNVCVMRFGSGNALAHHDMSPNQWLNLTCSFCVA